MNIRDYMSGDKFFKHSFGNPLVYLADSDYVCGECMDANPEWGEDVHDIVAVYETGCTCSHCGYDIYEK